MDTVLDWRGTSFREDRAPIPAAAIRGEANLYVIGYDSGTVKVGYSKSPGSRIGAHVGAARRHGVEVTSVWVSGPHVEFTSNEAALKEWCGTRCDSQQGAEYFTGVTPADAAAFALTLPATRNQMVEAVEKSNRIPLTSDFAEQVRLGHYVVIDGDDYMHYTEQLAMAEEVNDLMRKLLGKTTPGNLIGALRRAVRKLERHPDGHLEWRYMHSRALELSGIPEIDQAMARTLDKALFGDAPVLIARRSDRRALAAAA